MHFCSRTLNQSLVSIFSFFFFLLYIYLTLKSFKVWGLFLKVMKKLKFALIVIIAASHSSNNQVRTTCIWMLLFLNVVVIILNWQSVKWKSFQISVACYTAYIQLLLYKMKHNNKFLKSLLSVYLQIYYFEQRMAHLLGRVRLFLLYSHVFV